MRKLAALAVIVVCGMTASPAFGQATRTWVSGVGDDANPCSRTAPCKTFAGAISKTAVDGIIDAMDDGGFGAVTITKSITIDGAGHSAGLLASGGINAVNIAIPPTDPNQRVTLRGLNIEGHGTTLGLNGVNVVAGTGAETIHLENVHISHFSRAGVFLSPGPGAPPQINLSLENVVIEDSGNGLNIRPGDDLHKVNALVRNSVFTNLHTNGLPDTGIGVAADTGAHVWLTGDTIFGNDVGLRTFATKGADGVIDSFCDNQIGGNLDDGTKPNELCPQPAPQVITSPPQVVTQTVPAPKQCIVPKLKGLTTAFAKRLLAAANCALGTVTKKATTKRGMVGKVMTQKVRAGTALPQGTKVKVTVGRR